MKKEWLTEEVWQQCQNTRQLLNKIKTNIKEANNSIKRTFFRYWRSCINGNPDKGIMEKYWDIKSRRSLDLLLTMGKKKQAQKNRQKSIRQAKKQWLINLAEEAEQEERQGRSWEAWQIIK
eukprot:11735517-Prorocentrum_lima.AAC.1